MYDVFDIQNKIIDRPELIEVILENLGYEHIQDKGKYYSFPNHGGDNMSACSILKSTLQYQNYSHGGSGNVFTLVMDEKNLTFPQCLRAICGYCGFTEIKKKKEIKLPFHGFFKSISKSTNSSVKKLKTYSLNILPPQDSLSDTWAKDGACLKSQEKFGVRYSHEDDAVLIPIFNIGGELVGCKSRSMAKDVTGTKRFYAKIPYSKTNVLYGLNVNYKNIVSKRTVVVFESEKSVLQCDSFGFNYSVAIAGHDISDTQARMIKSLMCDKIIVAFDEGICEEEIIYNCKKLKTKLKIYNPKIGYIYDRDNKYLKKGSKDSPSDLGYKNFKGVMKECVTWL